MAISVGDVCLVILAFILPPVAVLVRVGCGLHFWLNILLCFLGWFPAIIHAIWVVLSKGPHQHVVVKEPVGAAPAAY